MQRDGPEGKNMCWASLGTWVQSLESMERWKERIHAWKLLSGWWWCTPVDLYLQGEFQDSQSHVERPFEIREKKEERRGGEGRIEERRKRKERRAGAWEDQMRVLWVTGSCQPPDADSGTWMWVPCTIKWYSKPLNLSSIPIKLLCGENEGLFLSLDN